MSDVASYSNFELCPDLRSNEKCIVVRRYKNGETVRLVHEHVPAHRLSKENVANLLRTLVIGSVRRSDDEIHSIIGYFLNARGREPARRPLPLIVEWSEPGVKRSYCGGHIMAWCDEVSSKEHFRQG